MILQHRLESLDLEFDELFYKRCEQFISLLQQWGKVHNLSAELETNKIIKNIVDSVHALKFIEDFESFADIGTGAGYPGLIIAMAKPNSKAYLIEPRAKRVAFLTFIKNSLQLDNVEVICNRVENINDITPSMITSRAVTNTSLLLDLTQNISNESTSYLFYKGSMLQSELEEAKVKSYKVFNVDERNYLYIKGKN